MKRKLTLEVHGEQGKVAEEIERLLRELRRVISERPDYEEIDQEREGTSDLVYRVSEEEEDHVNAERSERGRPLSRREISAIQTFMAKSKSSDIICFNELISKMTKAPLNAASAPDEKIHWSAGSIINRMNSYFKSLELQIRIIAMGRRGSDNSYFFELSDEEIEQLPQRPKLYTFANVEEIKDYFGQWRMPKNMKIDN